MDTYSHEIVRVDRLATGGKEDGLTYGTHKKNILDHCTPSEYIPGTLFVVSYILHLSENDYVVFRDRPG